MSVVKNILLTKIQLLEKVNKAGKCFYCMLLWQEKINFYEKETGNLKY